MKEALARVELNRDELEALLTRVREALGEEAYHKLSAVVETLAYLTGLVEDKNTTIGRLRQLLFGARTEKTRNVLPAGVGQTPEADPPTAAAVDPSPPDEPSKAKPKRKAKGHGRNGAEAYRSATTLSIPHRCLRPGEACPQCRMGTLYRLAKPGTVVRITGQAPIHATVYELEKLRCNLCGELFTAEAPEGMGSAKYDPASASMIALLKYGSGLPFYRLERLQASLGMPLPASTQWDIVHQSAQPLYPAYEQLIREAAHGEVIYNDDTAMKILELLGQRPRGPVAQTSQRRGVFTSGIVATCEGHTIALFFTGRQHAGENLAQVLAQRAAELAPPIQMCDALSRNMPDELQTILANCLSHGRRRFVDVAHSFPEACHHVLEILRDVYRADAIAKHRRLSPDERLLFHQEHSGPLMEGLHQWLTEQLEHRHVEPNSGLGEAISYMLKHWKKLTLFLRQPGAPLDNNLCERALKRAIVHRKNSLFYKTQNGARVGDLYMSLIHTCQLCAVDPFAYLTALHRHCLELSCNPQEWMPWNYIDTLRRVGASPAVPA